MNIGFDAKRAYHNETGLGNYSRTLIRSLAEFFPDENYFLFNPKTADRYTLEGKNLHEITPKTLAAKLFTSAWRSRWVTKDLLKNKIELFHGLSHEIPFGLQKAKIPSVVTIHDLIHERYPEQYKAIDRKIYHQKFTYACTHADIVIAISEQTRQDIIDFYKVPEQKIRVCYQSCNEAFAQPVTDAEKQRIKELYTLPEHFFLYVGSVIERKNLLGICKAMVLLDGKVNIPLVVIGNGGSYKAQVKAYIEQQGLEGKVIFLSGHEIAKSSDSFITGSEFPAIYQMATAMIYPSVFEGFGIPVLEALWSRLPVITSNSSCLPEAGGPGSLYVDPGDPLAIAAAMEKIYTDTSHAATMQETGWKHAQLFTRKTCANNVMNVYKSLV